MSSSDSTVLVGTDGSGRLLGSVPATITHKAARDVLVVHTTGRGANSS